MKGQGHALQRDRKGGGFYPPGALGGLQPKIQCSAHKKRMPKPPFKPPASYEAAMEELEQLTGLIESGQLPLEQLLAGYERGAELLKYCRDKLQAVEEQVKVLDAGVLKPWASE
jgi:exodeoxyribonuclease VII small subunit